MKRRAGLGLAGLIGLAWMLGACSPQVVTQVVQQTVVVQQTQVVQQTSVVAKTSASPASNLPTATSASAVVSSPAPTMAPGSTTTAQGPTSTAQGPTATAESLSTALGPTASALGPTTLPPTPPASEKRVIELEWPASLRLGDSDIIRLALVPEGSGYSLQADFPEHTLQTQSVPVARPAGYQVSAVAALDGIGFSISPAASKEAILYAGEPVAWRWTVAARAPGQQRLSVTLLLRWSPDTGTAGSPTERQAFSRAVDVQVTSLMGMSQPQAMAAGFFGLLLGSFSLAAVVLTGGPRKARRSVLIQAVAPNPALVIEPGPGLVLSKDESGLLRALFKRYRRLVVQSEFHSGYSGARTLLALPIHPDGRADAATIVKIGRRAEVQREFENYEAYVKDSLPPVTARIQHPPVSLAGDPTQGWAAVQYTFISEPGHLPQSLRQALLQDPNPALLERLFETFGPNWWMQRRPYAFRLAQEYDHLLPPHYVLRPLSSRPAGLPRLDPRQSPGEVSFKIGDRVVVAPFGQVEPRADGQSLTLTGNKTPGQGALRLRWLDLVPPRRTPAEVVSTRTALFEEYTRGIDRLGLPDPLLRLDDLLSTTLAGTQSIIHGDLNLENVLVGPGGFVWLIDFARTGEGHPLFDFAHLETEIIAQVIAPRGPAPADYLRMLQAASDPLLEEVHSIARRCLFNPSQPGEYDRALYLTCLGALKYNNLSDYQKYLLYLTAAHTAAKIK